MHVISWTSLGFLVPLPCHLVLTSIRVRGRITHILSSLIHDQFLKAVSGLPEMNILPSNIHYRFAFSSWTRAISFCRLVPMVKRTEPSKGFSMLISWRSCGYTCPTVTDTCQRSVGLKGSGWSRSCWLPLKGEDLSWWVMQGILVTVKIDSGK